jgi:hypothetical protein
MERGSFALDLLLKEGISHPHEGQSKKEILILRVKHISLSCHWDINP